MNHNDLNIFIKSATGILKDNCVVEPCVVYIPKSKKRKKSTLQEVIDLSEQLDLYKYE